MKELSLHILDIVQNSIKAGAKNIEIIINESTADNLMTIEINDNGCSDVDAEWPFVFAFCDVHMEKV